MPADNISIPPENPGEPHLPVVILADTSISLELTGALDKLNQGISEFSAALSNDPLASGRMDVCLITFGDHVETVVPFCPASSFQPPVLTADGETCFNAGIIAALDAIQQRRQVYFEAGITSYAPWLVVITDGVPTDTERESEARSRLEEFYNRNKLVFLPMGVGSADFAILKSYTKNGDGVVLAAKAENFAKGFQYISDSLSDLAHKGPSAPPQLICNNSQSSQQLIAVL